MQRKLIKSFSADFNHDLLGQPASPGLYSHAKPEEHIRWNKELGVNTLYSFCTSHNGFAWYESRVAPVTPGLQGNFLKRLTELGHDEGLEVHGYFCLASNPWYEQQHPDEAVPVRMSPNPRQSMPLGSKYLDHVCRCVEEVLSETEIDGFLLDWFTEVEPTWVPVEQEMYAELMNQRFPGQDALTESEILEFQRRAINRAWRRLQESVRSIKPDVKILLNVPILPHVYPLYQGLDVMKECEWFLNESPSLDNADWIRDQVGDKPVLHNLTGWPEHDPGLWTQAVERGYHLFGYANCDAVTTLPPESNKHIAEIRKIYHLQ